MYQPGEWAWSLEHRQASRIVEAQDLWGEVFYRVWVPSEDAVVWVRAGHLRSTRDSVPSTAAWISYLAAAGRVADAISQDVPLASIEASVIPLPHQIRALSRAVSSDRIRYLLADEVGLGKTIEAGLIMRELKLRGLVRRTLVVAPRGLVTQWVAEMRLHFGEEFRLLAPTDISAFRRMGSDKNLWQLHDQVVVPMDSVKPVDGRRGWSHLQVAEYNRERFEDLVAAGWDLVIVDECHRLGGRTDQVARFRLGEGLAEASPYLLLLSATPHQGKTDAFHRIMWLLDAMAFPDPATVSRDSVQPYVIRTEKHRAITADGEPLFKPRRTQLVPIEWGAAHRQQRALYEAVTEYAREGYNQAIEEKRNYIGFLMLLMQRLVTSSTRAIRTTLARRRDVLQEPEEQLDLFPDLSEEEWSELDGQEQSDVLLRSRLTGLRNERVEVEGLLRLAESGEATHADAKAEALLDWIYRLQHEETDPNLKVLIFTEFVPTQEMLREFLSGRGFAVACLNGSMDLEERTKAQEAFAGEARILISTDAGGEGLNLQFCHVVVNYDIPWNPMRLEQRIGRVDRIGQDHEVRAINFILKDTVEYRVREVLEEKLATILEEFGMDKTGDVLDSAEAGAIFDDLYAEAVAHPERIAEQVDSLVQQVRERAQAVKDGAAALPAEAPLDPHQAQELIAHPLPAWVERMTTAYLRVHGGQVRQDAPVYDLVWPDGLEWPRVVFSPREAHRPGVRLVTLEEPRIRELTTRLPRFVPGQPIPVLRFPEIPPEIVGWWALLLVTGSATDRIEHRILPLFVHDDGRVLPPTARRLWDRMLEDCHDDLSCVAAKAAEDAFAGVMRAAEEHGRVMYDALVHDHRSRQERERAKGLAAFASRRRAINRNGLPAVRAHRLAELEAEERTWHARLEGRAEILPELTPILILRIEGQAT